MTPLDVDLMRAWLRAEPGNCAAALPRLPADERLALLGRLDAEDLARLLAHAPVWWLAGVLAETPDLSWADAIERVGLNPSVVHTLRAIPGSLRESLLGRISPQGRARLNRALAVPRDRVGSVLDAHIRVCHADESVAVVARRVERSPSEDAWVYVTDANDRYLGQFTLPTLAGAAPDGRVGEVPRVQRPRVATTLLLEDALRRADWRGHESLPVSDETGRFAGVLRLGTLVRTLRIDEDPPAEIRPFDLVGSVLTLWVRLLVSVVGRVDRRT